MSLSKHKSHNYTQDLLVKLGVYQAVNTGSNLPRFFFYFKKVTHQVGGCLGHDIAGIDR